MLFTNERVRALSDAVREGTAPLPDPDRRLTALEQQGKAVFERACAQCHGGPGQSTPQATLNDPPAPVIRFHNIFSQCPRPVDPGRRASCSRRARRSSLAMSAPTRSRCRLRRPAPTGTILPAGTIVRRTSSDPGRALLTGFVGGRRAQRRLGKVRCARTPGHQQDRAVLHQQQRRHARRDARSLRRAVQARGGRTSSRAHGVVPPIATTDGVHFDRRPAPEERAALLAYLKKL